MRVYQIAIPFFMRTALIYFLGGEYLGLNSLFTSILQVLNLAELGVGNAIVYSMYKPIAENDTVTLCALMKLYKLYYRGIGLFIAVIGLLLTPFVPYLIDSGLPDNLNVYILYLLNLAVTVLSYWLFAYKNSLLQAYQRMDVCSKIMLITNTVQYGCQFLVLIYIKNYYIYILVALISQALTNIITAVVANTMYPTYHAKGYLPKSQVKIINQRIKDLFTAKLGGTIVNSADTIVISAFLGLSMLAIYQNYYYIMSSVMGFVMIIFNACTAGIGNSLVTESKEKNYFDFERLAFLTIWISAICISCFLCLYQPFMTIWIGKKYLLNIKVVILICAYFYVYIINSLSCVYKDASGIWHEDRYRPLIGGLTNLVMNLLLVNIIGIYGIVLSTIFSYLFVAMPWLIYNLFHLVFHLPSKNYVILIIKGAVVSVIIAAVCYGLCSIMPVSGVVRIIVNLLICFVVSNLLLIAFYRNNHLYKDFIKLYDIVIKR